MRATKVPARTSILALSVDSGVARGVTAIRAILLGGRCSKPTGRKNALGSMETSRGTGQPMAWLALSLMLRARRPLGRVIGCLPAAEDYCLGQEASISLSTVSRSAAPEK